MKYGIMLSVRHLPSGEQSAKRKELRRSKYRNEVLVEYSTESDADKASDKLNSEQDTFKFSVTGFESLSDIGSCF
ncbi:MAG: hypothetical protein V3R25_06095 [Nitrosomonadaceae bacterium]